jgi:hypothetical protein
MTQFTPFCTPTSNGWIINDFYILKERFGDRVKLILHNHLNLTGFAVCKDNIVATIYPAFDGLQLNGQCVEDKNSLTEIVSILTGSFDEKDYMYVKSVISNINKIIICPIQFQYSIYENLQRLYQFDLYARKNAKMWHICNLLVL